MPLPFTRRSPYCGRARRKCSREDPVTERVVSTLPLSMLMRGVVASEGRGSHLAAPPCGLLGTQQGQRSASCSSPLGEEVSTPAREAGRGVNAGGLAIRSNRRRDKISFLPSSLPQGAERPEVTNGFCCNSRTLKTALGARPGVRRAPRPPAAVRCLWVWP